MCANNHDVILGEAIGAASPPQQLIRYLAGRLKIHVEGDDTHPEGLGLLGGCEGGGGAVRRGRRGSACWAETAAHRCFWVPEDTLHVIHIVTVVMISVIYNASTITGVVTIITSAC